MSINLVSYAYQFKVCLTENNIFNGPKKFIFFFGFLGLNVEHYFDNIMTVIFHPTFILIPCRQLFLKSLYKKWAITYLEIVFRRKK